MFGVGCALSVVRCSLFAFLSLVCLLVADCRSLVVDGRLRFVVCCLLFVDVLCVVCCVLIVARRALSVVCCMLCCCYLLIVRCASFVVVSCMLRAVCC